MKIEIKITDEAGNVQLYDVSGSLVSSDAIQKEAERFQKATANKMAIERTAFAQGALWVRSLFLTNDR
jgi:hypothetical protein